MKSIWLFLSLIFRWMSESCAGQAQFIEDRAEQKRVTEIKYLLAKSKLTPKEAKRLDLLLGKGNEVIILK